MRNPVTALVVLTALSAGALTLAPSASPATALPGPGAVIALHERLFDALDRVDYEAARSLLDVDLAVPGRKVVLLLDDGNGGEPLAGYDRKAAGEALATWAIRTGLGTTIVRQQAECASGELGYAVLEFERIQGFTDGSAKLRRFRSTSLVRFVDGGWKLFHWHVSPAVDDGQAIKG